MLILSYSIPIRKLHLNMKLLLKDLIYDLTV